MKYRIAIASKDGKVVTDHFGHCSKYLIVEVDRGEYEFLELKEVIPPCNGGSHTLEGIENVLKQLKDCKYVLVSQIGGGAEKILKDNNVSVFVYRGYIREGIKKIMNTIAH